MDGVCVCVAEARMCVFNMFVSSTKVFISSMKCVRLQLQKRSFSAQSAFITSNKPVERQCKLSLEVKSRDYHLVDSDEYIWLQCEIMLEGNHLLNQLLLGNWFRNPIQEQKLGEKVSDKLHFKSELDL